MTDKERMAYWKGGDSSRVLRFTNPYDYEDCIIGVSTDGRAVYDFMKVMEYVCDAEIENYDADDFEDEDEMRYSIMNNAAEMINHDLGCYNPAAKIPVFCRTDESVSDDSLMIECPYDFSSCVLGSDFRENRAIFSLSKMVDHLIEKCAFDQNDAIRYVYSLKKAGTVEHGVAHYVIVDDLYEHVCINPESYKVLNDTYSPDFEKSCFEVSGKELLTALKRLDLILPEEEGNKPFFAFIQIKKSDKDASQVYMDASDGRVIIRASLDCKNPVSISRPLYLNGRFEHFLQEYVMEDDAVKFFEGNDCLFVKVDNELFSTDFIEVKYPHVEKILPVGYPYTAEINMAFLSSFFEELNALESDEIIPVKLVFSDGKLTLRAANIEKSTACSYNCEEGFKSCFSDYYLGLLPYIYDNDFTVIFKEPLSSFMVNQDNCQLLIMPRLE